MNTPWPYVLPSIPDIAEPTAEHAREALRLITAHRGSRAELARRLGVPFGYITAWMCAASTPKPDVASRMEQEVGVPASWWAGRRIVRDNSAWPWPRPEVPETGGHQEAIMALAEVLAPYGAASELARRVGVAPAVIHHIRSGYQRPRYEVAMAMERELGIPGMWWADGSRAARWVAAAAGRAVTASDTRDGLRRWAEKWNAEQDFPAWSRIGMTMERMQEIIDGAMPTDDEKRVMAKNADIDWASWDK
jgi:transcriptional regulator with XRE-family HTH domain